MKNGSVQHNVVKFDTFKLCISDMVIQHLISYFMFKNNCMMSVPAQLKHTL